MTPLPAAVFVLALTAGFAHSLAAHGQSDTKANEAALGQPWLFHTQELYCNEPWRPFGSNDTKFASSPRFPAGAQLCRVDVQVLTGPSHAKASWSHTAANDIYYYCQARSGPWFDRYGGDVHLIYKTYLVVPDPDVSPDGLKAACKQEPNSDIGHY